MYLQQKRLKSQIDFGTIGASFRYTSEKREIQRGTVSYRVGNHDVNVTFVGNAPDFRKKVKDVFTGYVDRMFDRSDEHGNGPEYIVFLGKVNERVSEIEHGDHSIPISMEMFKSIPGTLDNIMYRNPTWKRVVEHGSGPHGGGHRVVVSKLREKKGGYDLSELHKDVVRTITDREAVTWGNVVAVPDMRSNSKQELAGVVYLGPHGSGKTESSFATMMKYHGKLVADDMFMFMDKGYVSGVGYGCIFSYKEHIPGIRYGKKFSDNPEMSQNHAKFFLDKSYPPRHLPIGELANMMEDGRSMNIAEIFNSAPVAARTIVFQVPYTKYVNLDFRKGVSPLDAFLEVEGAGAKQEYHLMSDEKKREMMSRLFVENGDIELPRELHSKGESMEKYQRTLVNLKTTYSDEELYRVFGQGWMWRHSEEYLCGPKSETETSASAGVLDVLENIENNSRSNMTYLMKERIRGVVSRAENIFLVGKNTPPHPSPRLSHLIADVTRN